MYLQNFSKAVFLKRLKVTYHVACVKCASNQKVALNQEWIVLAEKQLKGVDPEKKLTWKTPEGISIKPIYSKQDADIVFDELPG